MCVCVCGGGGGEFNTLKLIQIFFFLEGGGGVVKYSETVIHRIYILIRRKSGAENFFVFLWLQKCIVMQMLQYVLFVFFISNFFFFSYFLFIYSFFCVCFCSHKSCV